MQELAKKDAITKKLLECACAWPADQEASYSSVVKAQVKRLASDPSQEEAVATSVKTTWTKATAELNRVRSYNLKAPRHLFLTRIETLPLPYM
jgi:hypothetical protein